jgi:hypothetical protein
MMFFCPSEISLVTVSLRRPAPSLMVNLPERSKTVTFPRSRRERSMHSPPNARLYAISGTNCGGSRDWIINSRDLRG